MGDGAPGRDREGDVLERLLQGDRRALEELVDGYGGDLVRYLHAILSRREDAEDVFQDTWVTVMRRAASFDPARGSFAAWLFRIARNRAFDLLRRRRRWRLLGFGSPQDEGGFELPSTPSAAVSTEDRDTVRRLLRGLTAAQRELVWLRFAAGYSLQEISTVVGVPVGTVKSRLSRTLHAMGETHARLEVNGARC